MRRVLNEICVVFAAILLFCLSFSACNLLDSSGKHLQKQLISEMQRAERLTDSLSMALSGSSFDTIWNLTQSEKHILFFVFNSQGMVYWSQNWLAASDIVLNKYNEWYYYKFDNAHTVCYWTYANGYNILTVVPIKYAYPIENNQLHNTFIEPFNKHIKADISIDRQDEGFTISNSQGKFLFKLVKANDYSQAPRFNNGIDDSFSFRSLNEGNAESDNTPSALRIKIYSIAEIVLYALIILMGIVSLIRSHGFRQMKLRTKVYFLINTLVVFVSIYVFAVSTIHMRERQQQHQEKLLKQKTVYIQKALQDLYYWNIALTQRHTSGMNIDLRDLAITYETDIQVYDIGGNLIGSSSPSIFELGLLSRHIDPEPFFSKEADMIRYEQIGDLHYLTSYAKFVNGNYAQIGYISVPLYLSSSEIEQELNRFLAKLLPPNLIVLILSFIISFFVVRSITRPLSNLSEKMRHFKIGDRNNKLQYYNSDEVGQLVVRYNEMVAELERSAERLARSEREEAWRTMARQIAHEINNPLTPMRLTIQQLQRTKKIGGDKFDKYFDSSTELLIEQIDQLSRIAASFSQFARMPDVIPQQVDIAKRLFDVVTLFRNNEQQIQIRYIGPQAEIYALADDKQISQVFNNLIKNALQAIEGREEGDVIVMLKDEAEEVEISISDNGCGIAEDVRDKIFRPNFTTKSTGTGLGLAISKHIVEATGGSIRFETSDNGTIFYVVLPKK